MPSRKRRPIFTGIRYGDFRIGWKTLCLVLVALYLILNFKFNINMGFVSCGSKPMDVQIHKKVD